MSGRAVAVLLVLLAPLGARAQAPPVQRGIKVLPESVTVGQPFQVVVRIRAARGARIEFPQGPDSSTTIEVAKPVVLSALTDTTTTDQSATYSLIAWDVGRLPIGFADVLVRDAEGTERRVPLVRGVGVTVVSVLPADSAQRIPKSVRAVFEPTIPWWYWLIVALIAAGLLALWWWWRRRRRAPTPTVARDPYDEAVRAFERVEALGLITAGQGSTHVALCADVMREYLSRVLPRAMPSLTSTELLGVLKDEPRAPGGRLARTLHEVDIIKFAGRRTERTRAIELAEECRAIVVAVHEAAIQAPLEEGTRVAA